MSLPKIEIVPIKPAVRSDAPVTLDVLIRITPPTPQVAVNRPPLNLGLVIDRSGSMDGRNKLTFAKEAAIFAVQQLIPTDRVSLTVFDDTVQTPVTNTVVENKNKIIDTIQAIHSGGSTNLHGGWAEGSQQVRGGLVTGGLNRVILLSDGQANVGETNPDTIGTDVHKAARTGVSTTAIGLGDDYNEKLLEAMANSGDGNYYYVESAGQLPGIFERELKELMGLSGNTVSLGLEPQSGVEVGDTLNDLEKLPTGRFPLPNLIAGLPVYFVARLKVPALATERELLRIRLAWNEPKSTRRHELYASLSLPPVTAAIWDALAPNTEVQERVALLEIARLKKIAAENLAKGDRAAAMQNMCDARQSAASVPGSPELAMESDAIGILVAQLNESEDDKFNKFTTSQTHSRRRSKPMPWQAD